MTRVESVSRLTGKLRRGHPFPEGSRLRDTERWAPPVDDELLIRVLDVLEVVARETDRTIPQVAINWLLSRPTVTSVLIGARDEAQLSQNLGAVRWALTDEQRSRLDAASRVPPPYPYYPYLNGQFGERNPPLVRQRGVTPAWRDSHPRCARLGATFERVGVGALCGLAVVAGAASAHAQASDEGPRLEWRAPAGCAAREEVLARLQVLARKGDVRWDRFERIDATVEREGARWAIRLAFVHGGGVRRRNMTSGRCQDLVEASALAIVLAHRSSGAAGDAATAESSTPRVNEAPQADPALAASIGARAPAAEPGVVPDTLSGAQPEPTSTLAATALAVALEGLLDPGTLGSAAFGAAVGFDARWAGFHGGLYGAAFPSTSMRLGAGQSIEIALWTMGLRGCRRWGRGLDTCAQMELGRVHARGLGLIASSHESDTWAAPGLSVGFRSTPFDGFSITTRLSAFHPLVRGRFRVDESEVVHTIPFIGWRAAVGIDVPLL